LSLAHYAQAKIGAIPGFEAVGNAPFFNEFAVAVTRKPIAEILEHALQQRIIAGLDLGRVDSTLSDRLLIAVTERHTKQDIDRLCAALASA
jgi:glycine dehydrogenase subunit 1